MNRIHFSISEFIKLDGYEATIPIIPELATKVVKYHIWELNPIRNEIQMPVHVRSGHRPKWWERLKGRDPKNSDREDWSQHCYVGKGAGDYSIEETSERPYKPVEYWITFFRLLKNSSFKRIAFYPGLRFFHCDYRGNSRKYYNADWVEIEASDVGQLIRTNQNGN